jgi:hypothetical protein
MIEVHDAILGWASLTMQSSSIKEDLRYLSCIRWHFNNVRIPATGAAAPQRTLATHDDVFVLSGVLARLLEKKWFEV